MNTPQPHTRPSAHTPDSTPDSTSGSAAAPDNRSLQRQPVDIAIVGGGMIGAAMALRLSGLGWRLALLDGQAIGAGQDIAAGQGSAKADDATADHSEPDYDARVSALTHASQNLFESLGVWQAMRDQRVSPYLHMHVREADGTGKIDFSAADIHVATLGHIVENRVTTTALHSALLQKNDIEILAPMRVDGYQSAGAEGQHLQLSDGSTLPATLVIAADGANSPLRQLAAMTVREWDYGHQAVVTTVRTEQAHGQTARQTFMDDGILAFLPLAGGDGHYSSIVWSLVPERASEAMAMNDTQFAAALALASERWLGAVESSARRFCLPLYQRHAVDYINGHGLVLIGDAAHSIHPLAGQGANLGLLDVTALAEELARGRRSGRSPADPVVLARYQRRRKPHNLMMMAMMEGFKRLYSDQPLPPRWLRNTGMHTVDRWPTLKNRLMREALG